MTGNAHSEHVKLTTTMSPLQKNRALNDHFRKTANGGIVSISWGIHMLGRAEVDNIMNRLGGTDGDNSCDVGSEHDMGEITVNNRRIHWEINYYNKEFDDISVDSTNPDQTTRFMTLLLDSEL
ncbi:DUF3768 domain-containing protein [Phaeobacter gallaeciensis]|uniref:DUF3768 domain-containing protein n=1 Tax=Phaeobacter gallaeciensis TaxID=60890 RepID=UPI00237EF476|nr:DUF3768 domain-containing protein [Phaeobacter gallaeciensis]MDE4140960.1 DUF3768 domain-containing protein [Phaeobacter gallaeciensis]MDE4149405.1 DUF3768 domain-containing protein [Phaeobacter gallaeciensis]MDE4153402.1 DUF3768 domain-containing protein [Phaeobacter gallaeciensis]MDE4228791.1 DUF3768 domain-containing protein [Phaeobacter gallaeciensis]MDE4257866.1 DUF3768 domain-containing protein [Phaeobacter gallaeciensis]